MGLFKRPKVMAPASPPPPPPLTPTIDDAARSEEFSRKLARRRGHMANVRRAGGVAASVAVKELLG